MKVLLVNKFLPGVIGGVETHVGTLARFLAKEPGVTGVTVLGFGQHSGASQADGYEAVALRRWGQLGPVPLGPGLRAAMRSSSADLVHIHVPSGLPEVEWLLARDPRPLIVTYHAPALRPALLRPAYRFILSAILNRADRIIATSPNMAAADAILRRFGHKVAVVPLGVDPAPFAPTSSTLEAARRLRACLSPAGEPVVLFVGRMVAYKGLQHLLQAVPIVRRMMGRAVRWVLVGDGPLRPSLTRMAGYLGNDVVFTGAVRPVELASYYYAADLFVLPSVRSAEAFGLVQVEAHLCGLPVVSTNLPTGVPFVNRHGETGLVVPPGQPARLAEAVSALLADEDRRRRMGDRARARATEAFGAARMARHVVRLYSEVL